uniref:Protein phosphatase 1 regulatory subunit 35 C-terminal domain-containing protein n=1 Tax=Meloidogyne javanica TaxID=6303 RepID=A0A915MN45_MELJA
METKLTNNVLTKYTPRGAIPTASSERMVLKKNLMGKQLSLPTKVTLPASSSKYISKNKSCRHMSVNNCLQPSPVIIRKDKALDKMLLSEKHLEEINGKNEILPKLDISENEEVLKKETVDAENYKIDRLPNNYHPLFPYDLIEIRSKKNEKI